MHSTNRPSDWSWHHLRMACALDVLLDGKLHHKWATPPWKWTWFVTSFWRNGFDVNAEPAIIPQARVDDLWPFVVIICQALNGQWVKNAPAYEARRCTSRADCSPELRLFAPLNEEGRQGKLHLYTCTKSSLHVQCSTMFSKFGCPLTRTARIIGRLHSCKQVTLGTITQF